MPTTTYIPSYLPTITSQWFRTSSYSSYEAESCVSNALASIAQIYAYRQRGVDEQFSHMWIWGNRQPSHTQDEWMMYDEAANQMVSDGVPPYHDCPHPTGSHAPSTYWYNAYYDTSLSGHATAKSVISSVKSSLSSRAFGQRFSGWTWVNTYDIELIQSIINSYGAVLFPIQLSNSFYSGGSGGVIPQADSSDGNGIGHAVVIVGWKQIGGELHWICINSWGTWWGDGGLCYIPHLYGLAFSSMQIYPSYGQGKLNTPIYYGAATTSDSITISYQSEYEDGFPDNRPFQYHIRCRLGTEWDGVIVEDKYVSSPYSVTFTGLSPNTYYNFVCCALRGGYDDSDYSARIVFQTDDNPIPVRPPYYNWTYTKTSGGLFNLTAAEWNALCANVNDVREYYFQSPSYRVNFTQAYTNNNVTAAMFNQVKYAIDSVNNKGMNKKYTGDIIYAADMNTLVTKLNAVP